MSNEQVYSVKHWQVAECFDDQQRTVLAYVDYLMSERGRVPEAVFDKLKGHLSDQSIIELTYVTCSYIGFAVLTRALRLEFDDRDDPVVEVVASECYSGANFMGRRPDARPSARHRPHPDHPNRIYNHRSQLMSVYAIFIRDRMHDLDEFKTYSKKSALAGTGHTMKAHVYYEPVETIEGPVVDGVVLVEFPDIAAAHAWYDSPAYQEAKAHRLRAANYRVMFVEGMTPRS